MRDFRLDPEDIEHLPLAYQWLTEQPNVDPARSGLLGTCVGGSFALMAAASPLIRDRVSFIGAYAPFSSMATFAHDIASATHCGDAGREPWRVDQLTRHVFVHSVTAML
jgi:dienelactone hydrolase